jgi:XRE family transcriptional regulator, fatty acid utilization regulator
MEKLKSIRLARNQTQKEFAEQLEISQPYLNQLESGKRKPSHDKLIGFANRLGVTVNDLVGENE